MHRPTEPEWMDLPTFDRQQALDTFRFIEIVNRWLGGSAALVSFFARESRSWQPGRTYRLLDAGCGSGDCAVALARWARRAGVRVQIDAVDSHSPTLELARQTCAGHPEIACACRDVFEAGEDRQPANSAHKGRRYARAAVASPLVGAAGRGDSREYDYIIMSMFLHHFPDEQIPDVLQRLLDRCRVRLVINDLVRSPLHYGGTWAFTLLTSAVFRHDARLSVRKGFVPSELERLLRAGGLQRFRLERRFFYRFLLILDPGRESGYNKEASS